MTREKSSASRRVRDKRLPIALWGFVVLLAAAGICVAAGCSSQSTESADAKQGENNFPTMELNAIANEDWAAYLPKIITKEDGTRVQKTPLAEGGYRGSGYGYATDFRFYNTYILNADQRGCNSCHELESVMKARVNSGAHELYVGTYEAESMPWGNCVACHMAYDVNLMDSMHAHMDRESFRDMGGSCNSCHYIDEDGNYLMWDDVKYDVMKGMTDIEASDMDIDVEWNQDEITPAENMFQVQSVPHGYAFANPEFSDSIRDEWTVKFSGEMDNPSELTIQQMIDMFGTETRVQTIECTINGTGGSLIFQAEVTGIPLNKIMDYLQLRDTAKVIDPIGVDGYDVGIYTSVARECNPLLVFEMNGQELNEAQGYPLMLCYGEGISAGLDTRYLCEMQFSEEGLNGKYPGNGYLEGVYGAYTYPYGPHEGELISTPNIGVLTAESGQIFNSGEPVHLEGYAYAYNEQVTKVEFSFDHGNTWTEVSTEGSDSNRWVYWKMDVHNLLEPGSYLLQMRATSVTEEGVQHTNSFQPQFLINVQ